MQELKLGQIITTPQQRDAIHIAVIPVVADEALRAGQGVAFVEGHTGRVRAFGTTIGIVDPYLSEPVERGQQFWMFMYPGSINSLRHEWTHPAIDGTPDKVEARQVIERIADAMGLSYDALMDYGRDHAKGWGDDYVTQQGSEEWRDNFNADTFWPAYETVTGEAVSEDKKDHFFSCSC